MASGLRLDFDRVDRGFREGNDRSSSRMWLRLRRAYGNLPRLLMARHMLNPLLARAFVASDLVHCSERSLDLLQVGGDAGGAAAATATRADVRLRFFRDKDSLVAISSSA